ncbi:transmembrane protease serine 3-like [Amblyomma americanum]
MSPLSRVLCKILFLTPHLALLWSPIKAQEDKINRPDCGISQPVPRIINGSTVAKTQVPWLVRIVRHSSHGGGIFCGGSIITRNVIVTAAHCVKNSTFNPKGTIYVFYNSTNLSGNPVILAKRGVVHRLYENPFQGYDIALLKLSRPLPKFDNFVRPVCLPRQSEETPEKKMLLAGFGFTNYEGKGTKQALYLVTKAMKKDDCEKRLRTPNGTLAPMNLIFCTNHRSGSAFQGDSGSGLTAYVQGGRAPKSVLFGIVSFGQHRAFGVAPNIFTRISMYRRWIENSLKNIHKWKKVIK